MMWIAVTLPLVDLALTAFSKPKEALKEVVDSSEEIMHNAQFTMHNPETVESEVVETPAPAPEKKKQKEQPVKAGDKITGTVKKQNGEPFQYANIMELDEYGRIVATAISDESGNFTLKVVNPQYKIRISYVGMKSQTIELSCNKFDVTLEEFMNLSDVKVVGRRDSIDRNAPRYKDEDTTSGDDGTFNMVEQADRTASA